MASLPQATVAATTCIKNSSISFVESVITEMIYRETLDETPKHSFNHWSGSDTFMQVSVEKIFNHPGFITPVAAFVSQCVINALGGELQQEPQVIKKFPPPPEHSSSASAGATPDKDSRARRSRRKHRDSRAQKQQCSLEDLREKRRLARRSQSASDADSTLRTPKNKSSGSSSRSCSNSFDIDRERRPLRCSK